jgi:hypothetical protein
VKPLKRLPDVNHRRLRRLVLDNNLFRLYDLARRQIGKLEAVSSAIGIAGDEAHAQPAQVTELAELPKVPCGANRVLARARATGAAIPGADDRVAPACATRVLCACVQIKVHVIELGRPRRWPGLAEEGPQDRDRCGDDRDGTFGCGKNDELGGRVGEVGVSDRGELCKLDDGGHACATGGVSRRLTRQGHSDSQDPHAHGKEDTKLFPLVHGERPNDFPGYDCEHDVHSPRVNWQIVSMYPP